MSTLFQLQKTLESDTGVKHLAELYGISKEAAKEDCNHLQQVVLEFERTFPQQNSNHTILCTAAGRTEVSGNHTDHQRGKVLAASVTLDAVACAAPNQSRIARLYSDGYGMVEISVDDLASREEENNTTAALIRGILFRISELGYKLSGFDACIHSSVPGGSGLSSSACYEVLVGIVVNRLFCNNALSLEALAQIGQYAENHYFGKPSGLMDQMACALGGIVSIDFQDETHPVCHPVPFDFSSAGYALCIVDTGADHADLTDDYGAIPQEMCLVAKEMGHEVLSQVAPEEFYSEIPRLREACGDRAILRAIHYFNEVERVDRQVKALEAGDFSAFLQLVNESGLSSSVLLQNISTFRTAAAQPVAVALALAEHLLQGRGASRVHGGGFAGTIQAFVPMDLLDSFRKGMEASLRSGCCRVLSIRPVGGAVLFD